MTETRRNKVRDYLLNEHKRNRIKAIGFKKRSIGVRIIIAAVAYPIYLKSKLITDNKIFYV